MTDRAGIALLVVLLGVFIGLFFNLSEVTLVLAVTLALPRSIQAWAVWAKTWSFVGLATAGIALLPVHDGFIGFLVQHPLLLPLALVLVWLAELPQIIAPSD